MEGTEGTEKINNEGTKSTKTYQNKVQPGKKNRIKMHT